MKLKMFRAKIRARYPEMTDKTIKAMHSKMSIETAFSELRKLKLKEDEKNKPIDGGASYASLGVQNDRDQSTDYTTAD